MKKQLYTANRYYGNIGVIVAMVIYIYMMHVTSGMALQNALRFERWLYI